MKLIHCADIHLDAPLSAVFSDGRATAYRRTVLTNFAALVELADQSRADALLIAGDLFDSDEPSEQTVSYVLSLFAEHPALPIFYLSGNHDGGGLGGRRDLPKNLHPFGRDWTYYRIGNLTVAGGSAPDPDRLELPRDGFNVVLLHGQINGAGTDEYGIPLSRLRGKNIDYLALGHLHTYREERIDSRAVACYSGCLMGRGFDECGRKGYVLLETVNSRLTHRFVPFASRTFHAVTLDIGDRSAPRALELAAREATAQIPREDFCLLTLRGEVSPDALPDVPGLAAALDGRFGLLRIRNETSLAVDPRDYENDISLKGEFIRRVLSSELSEKEKDRIIACGLRALRGEEVTE